MLGARYYNEHNAAINDLKIGKQTSHNGRTWWFTEEENYAF